MIAIMARLEETGDLQANQLCKACGLCCTGHLFLWTKLISAELDAVEALGVKVLRSVPSQRGFNQPCPLWNGQCTIYDSPTYPHFCQTYKCSLLKKVLDETTSFGEALELIRKAKAMIRDLEARLPNIPGWNFRERLEAQIASPGQDDLDLQQKTSSLLNLYRSVFGVKDVVEMSPEV